jgi:putative flippase GtrA
MTALRRETGRVARFAVVGLVATAVHAFFYTLLAETVGMDAMLANWLGFAIAFSVSLFGHSMWTFGTGLSSARAARFLLVAAMGLGANTFFVWLVVEAMAFRPVAALPFIVFVTPALTYMVSRFWAFT